jgi:hypothetical protein
MLPHCNEAPANFSPDLPYDIFFDGIPHDPRSRDFFDFRQF